MGQSDDGQVDGGRSELNGDAHETSDVGAMYEWLGQLLNAQRARLAQQSQADVDAQFEASLRQLEHAFDLLREGVWWGNTLDAVRNLIAIGMVWWHHAELLFITEKDRSPAKTIN